jgi:abortive infection bacteriophage resistance protein
MPNKTPYNIEEQIQLLKSRGMLFKDEAQAALILKNISYYRLKGYWWDMQTDRINHIFKPGSYFEDVIERYNFDRHLRLILFDALELIEIALRTKMIYHLSLSCGGQWYLDSSLFADADKHRQHLADLKSEYERSKEIFIKDQKLRHPSADVDAWKILEIASFGTLSKLYKNIQSQLPEKTRIAQELGFNQNSELCSWLEAITYIRNIIAHHSRLWSRNMVKKPIENLNNPKYLWFSNSLLPVQTKKPFLIISCMLYLCICIKPDNHIKAKIKELFQNNPNIQIYKLGFLNNWNEEPIWK